MVFCSPTSEQSALWVKRRQKAEAKQKNTMSDSAEIHANAALLAYASSDSMLRTSIAILKLRKRQGTLADLDLIIAYTALAEPATRNDHDGLASVARAAKENFERRCLWPAFQPKTSAWLA